MLSLSIACDSYRSLSPVECCVWQDKGWDAIGKVKDFDLSPSQVSVCYEDRCTKH